MEHEAIIVAKEKMQKSINAFKEELANVRTGRASSSLVSNVEIDYYGSMTPIYQISNISIPEARQIVIKPYDKNDLRAIETAIINANLNLTPLNDGIVLRVNVPALTEEKRKQYVKEVYSMGENAKIAIRNIRRDANASLKSENLREDELRTANDDVQKITDESIKNVDELVKAKEKELLTV